MLQQLRDFGSKRVVRLIFALFLIIPFGFFGIDYYFRTPVGGDTLAAVGPARIGSQEFDNALRQQADVYRQQFRGNFDPSIMDNPEIRRAVLDRLVNEKLVAIGAQKAGVRVGDKELARRIGEEPFFQVDGRFSKDRYDQVAKGQGLTAVGLDERLREDYRQQEFRQSILDTAFVPRATLDGFIRLSEQTREVSVVNLAPDAYLSQVSVKPEDVKAYYDKNPAEFTTAEQARVEYVEVSTDALAAQATAAPEEIASLYEQGLKAGRFGEVEQRKASHILITVKPDAPAAEKQAAEAKAKAIAERVRKAPATFAETAKKESQDPGSAAGGGDLGYFSRGAMVKPFEDAVFAAKKGDILGPVASDFGYHVIQVTDVKPAKVKSLADATPELEAQIRKQAASRRFAEVAEQFSNMVYEQPASLKPAAEALKLSVKESGWITKGTPATPPFLSNPKLVAEIFSPDAIKNKRNTSAIEVAPGTLVAAHVVEHKPPQLRPFETVQAEIQRRLQREEALKRARAEGEAKLKDLQAGKEASLKWPAPLGVNRQKPGGLFPQVIDRVFRVDAKKLPAYVGIETPAGYSLVQVSKVIEVDKVDDAKREALAVQLRDAVAAQEFEATLASLRSRVGVTVRKDALEKKSSDSQQR
jgi:peptidyl-prolyl cis-trans isomerase D